MLLDSCVNTSIISVINSRCCSVGTASALVISVQRNKSTATDKRGNQMLTISMILIITAGIEAGLFVLAATQSLHR